MIQDFSLNIKSAFNSFDFKFFDEPDFDTVERIETYCLNNINASTQHTHNNSTCKSSQLVYFKNYSRHYVSYHDSVQDNMITIPVLYCKNDKHYHAVLPNSIIVPYSSFSIFFILKVLALKSCSAFTIEEITERFCISTSTLYRWISKYNVYLRIFNTLKTDIICISLCILFMISVMLFMISLTSIFIHFFNMTALYPIMIPD